MPLKFQVPQFTDVEDRVIGPLTIKQFLMFVMDALIVAAFYVSFPLPITVILGIPVTTFFGLLAFFKVNGRSFIWFLYAIIHFLFTGKMFLWDRRGDTPRVRVGSVEAVEAVIARRGLTTSRSSAALESRIQRLAQILDTSGKVVDEDLPAPPAFQKA